ncbi:MAG: TetR/AcrR family transcriptional regulator [Acidimicrobiales bacterium]
MVRTPPAERLTEVADAATRVFGRLGYRRTRTSDVAAQAGLSSGALFTYVASKEALFHLVFTNGFGQYADGLPPLPLATPALGETLRVIEHGLRRADAPRLMAALQEHEPTNVRAELSGIVEERYGLLEHLWPLLAVIEKSAVDLPELEEFYYGRARPAYLGRLVRYLEDRVAGGYFTAMADSKVAARIVSETIVWFAWHRHEGRDAMALDDEGTRRTVVEFICAALLGGRR